MYKSMMPGDCRQVRPLIHEFIIDDDDDDDDDDERLYLSLLVSLNSNHV